MTQGEERVSAFVVCVGAEEVCVHGAGNNPGQREALMTKRREGITKGDSKRTGV